MELLDSRRVFGGFRGGCARKLPAISLLTLSSVALLAFLVFVYGRHMFYGPRYDSSQFPARTIIFLMLLGGFYAAQLAGYRWLAESLESLLALLGPDLQSKARTLGFEDWLSSLRLRGSVPLGAKLGLLLVLPGIAVLLGVFLGNPVVPPVVGLDAISGAWLSSVGVSAILTFWLCVLYRERSCADKLHKRIAADLRELSSSVSPPVVSWDRDVRRRMLVYKPSVFMFSAVLVVLFVSFILVAIYVAAMRPDGALVLLAQVFGTYLFILAVSLWYVVVGSAVNDWLTGCQVHEIAYQLLSVGAGQ